MTFLSVELCAIVKVEEAFEKKRKNIMLWKIMINYFLFNFLIINGFDWFIINLIIQLIKIIY